MVKTCSNPACKHEYQDKVHGAGKRVMNPLKKTAGAVRCTVCDREQPASNAVAAAKEKKPAGK